MSSDLQRQVAATSATSDVGDAQAMGGALDLFTTMVHAVISPEDMPDAAVNTLGRSLLEMFHEFTVQLGFDPSPDAKELRFTDIPGPTGMVGVIVMQRSFVYDVREDLLGQLCSLVNVASQARDFRAGRFEHEDPARIARRARAYEAQALLTVMPVLQQRGQSFKLGARQQEVLGQYPQGLRTPPRSGPSSSSRQGPALGGH